MKLTNAIVLAVFVASLMLSAKQCSAQRPDPIDGRGGSTSIDRVKMDFRVRAQFAGECSGAILASNTLFCLTPSGFLVYNLGGGRGAVLVATGILQDSTSPRDVVLSRDGQDIYVADYSSRRILAYSIPQTAQARTRTVNVRVPLKSTLYQLTCRPTSLSIDAITGDLLVACSDDRQLFRCSNSTLGVQSLQLPSLTTRLIHATWLAGQSYATLVQTTSGYTICLNNPDGSTDCPYTLQQGRPVSIIGTPDNSITVVDQASNNALLAFGPRGDDQRGYRIQLNANIRNPRSILIDYFNSQMAVISQHIVTVFDVQVTIR